jgi:hypothetical protein
VSVSSSADPSVRYLSARAIALVRLLMSGSSIDTSTRWKAASVVLLERKTEPPSYLR